MWSSQEREILHELDQFQVTLNHVTGGPFAERAADKDNSWQPSTTDADDSEATHIAMTVFGYATHIVNVLRILVGSKCESFISHTLETDSVFSLRSGEESLRSNRAAVLSKG
jgi:hypothetical protein